MTIEKGDMTVSDTKDNLIETKDGITCGCENPSLTMACHIDGVDFYSYQYNCQCGNSITVNYKRKRERRMLVMREICGECKYSKFSAAENEFCCCNTDSDNYGSPTMYDDSCEDFEEKE